jgi:hypothetical protein
MNFSFFLSSPLLCTDLIDFQCVAAFFGLKINAQQNVSIGKVCRVVCQMTSQVKFYKDENFSPTVY